MEKQTLTIKQVLEITARNLESISVPVSQIQQIGVPLANAVANLQVCIGAIAEQEAQKEEQADDAEDEEEIEN